MKTIFKFKSRSAADTKKIARKLGGLLGAGDVVALSGELGAGKTTFVKGMAKALGVRSEDTVSSPTFVIIHEYAGKLPLYHLDWYRLKKVEGADREMAVDCFEAKGVTLVEWPERGKKVLPSERIEITLSHRGGTARSIEIRPVGKRYGGLLL